MDWSFSCRESARQATQHVLRASNGDGGVGHSSLFEKHIFREPIETGL
jgi:hypothetical protein